MSKVIPLFSKKTKEGREPLFVSHIDGTVKGPNKEDFGDRIQRIRTSLEKINKLMAELKGKEKYEQDKGTTES